MRIIFLLVVWVQYAKSMKKLFCEQSLSKYKLYSTNQFGFRRSCNHVIAEVTDYIRNEIDKRGSDNACFIDSKKTVDTLDYTISSEKFSRHGFRGPIFSSSRTCLSDSKQYVFPSANITNILPSKTGFHKDPFSVHFFILTIYYNRYTNFL